MLQFSTDNFLFFLKAALLSLLISSCAQVVAPGGGKRDTEAPKVVKYSPDSAQLNFNSRTIELTFNEYIQLKDLNNQLIISPPLESTPDIKVKNKTLTIDLGKQELKPNTTYSINFGNALQDINESNAKENFSYIFSTGSFIDSLKVNGKIQNAFDHKAEKGILVMLYSNMNDSAVYNDQPEYFAKTAADGSFRINNVRRGKYRLVALKDVNSNYKYDGDAENIGFYDSIVDPSAKKEIKLELFPEHAKKIFVKKYMHLSYGKIMLVFNDGSDSIRVKNLRNDKKEVQEIFDFSKNKDTLIYWLRNYDKDSLKLQVSNGSKIIDTLEFKMIKFEDAVKSRRSPLKLAVVSSPKGNQTFDMNSEIKIVFSQPIASVENANVLLKEDTTLIKNLTYNVNTEDHNKSVSLAYWDSTAMAEDPNDPGKVLQAPVKGLFTSRKENTNYHLFIPPGTFTDIFGLKNDSIQVDFKTKELKFYGSLKLSVKFPPTKGKYIVQLLNSKDAVVNERIVSKPEITEALNYEYLYPDKYRVKLIYDENGNGKWDTGDYLKGIQPERVLYNPELITIRSNWDAEIEWLITNKDPGN